MDFRRRYSRNQGRLGAADHPLLEPYEQMDQAEKFQAYHKCGSGTNKCKEKEITWKLVTPQKTMPLCRHVDQIVDR